MYNGKLKIGMRIIGMLGEDEYGASEGSEYDGKVNYVNTINDRAEIERKDGRTGGGSRGLWIIKRDIKGYWGSDDREGNIKLKKEPSWKEIIENDL